MGKWADLAGQSTTQGGGKWSKLAGISSSGDTVTIPEGAPVSPNYQAQPSETTQMPQPPESLQPAHIIEPAATIATGMVAQPIAGIVGLADMVTGGEHYGDMIHEVQNALTYNPRSPQGQEGLKWIGDKLQPISGVLSKAEQKLGDMGYSIAGPIGGAIGEMAPTAGLMAIGSAQVRNITGMKAVADSLKNVVTPSAKTFLKEAAPTIEGLQGAAGKIYKELGDRGVVISADSFAKLRRDMNITAIDEGVNPVLHPNINAVFGELNRYSQFPHIELKQMDILRRNANSARMSKVPDESRLGNILVNKIDDYLDTLKQSDLINGNAKGVGASYKDARQLWQRVRKSQTITDAIEKANLQASGFENGLRRQFTNILNDKHKLVGFSEDEIQAMRTVVKGTSAANITRALGKFGYGEGQATRMLMPLAGSSAAGAMFGTPGAIALPVLGQISYKLATRLTRGNAEFADSVIRAGKNGQQIVRAYLLHTPAKQRNVGELTQLLMRKDVDLKYIKPVEVPGNKNLIKDAVFFADFLQSQQPEKQ